MDCDLDPFDDFLPDRATKTARAGGKFQPKSKAQPRKKSSEPVPLTQSLQPVNNGENKSIAPVGSSLATSEATNPLKNNEFSFVEAQFSDDNRSFAHPSSECVVTTQSVGPLDGLHSHNVMPDGNRGWHSSFGKSPIENADIFFGLDSLDAFLSQTTSEMVSNADRSPPKTNILAEHQNQFPTSTPINTKAEASLPPLETATINVSDSGNREEGLGLPVVSPVDESTFKESNSSFPHTYPEVSMTQDTLTCVESTVSTSGGDFQVDNRMAGEEVEAFRCWDTLDIMSELTTSSGRKTRKFQPKPKAQTDKEKTCASIPNPDLVQSISCLVVVQPVPSETDYVDEGSIPAFSPDKVPDLSFTFRDSVPVDLTSELPVNEERTKVLVTSQSDTAIPKEHVEAVPLMPGKVVSQRAQNGRRKTPTVSNRSTDHQKDSTFGREDATGRSLRRPRKRTNACELIDESENEAHNDGDFLAESPSGSGRNEDKSDDDYQVENEPEDRTAHGKSKKPVAEKEKPVRKRKKANEEPDQSTKKPPKKFSHSTRRNRSKAHKLLLETLEDEIDPQKLNFRDLILLAEYNERISKKEATTSETPLTSRSAGNSFTHFNEDETFASEQAGGSNDEQGSPPRVQETSYINYQTYMNKTPSARWSKQDTELFYEAVQQFGTDLSLIQQLFPDRTCRQVKLKFKKEERQHPLRLHEALTSRTKDLTRFEQVFQRLQQLAAEEKQNSNRDDSTGLTGEEVELTPDIDEEAKSEQQIEEAVENVELDLSEVQSPIKSDNSEDELYRWNQYKSEF